MFKALLIVNRTMHNMIRFIKHLHDHSTNMAASNTIECEVTLMVHLSPTPKSRTQHGTHEDFQCFHVCAFLEHVLLTISTWNLIVHGQESMMHMRCTASHVCSHGNCPGLFHVHRVPALSAHVLIGYALNPWTTQLHILPGAETRF